ncbi:hypothetical protein [Paraburkholderia sp. J41]|uniref:hypothetical protein n=1 Tax=Paraburkholderia sp. J41 TaxID=2805433 RepID=UPI002AC3184E|nr:hypothetical protein [Paraburkholderia sp. J41]
MKRMLLIAAGFVLSAAFLAGCKTAPTAQQLFIQACPVVNADLEFVAASPLLTPDQQDTLNKQIIPKNKAFCAAGAQLNLADLKAFHDSLLPAAITIVEAVPAIPNQQAILLVLRGFGPLVQQLVDQVITTVGGAADSAASAPAVAAAPAAAGQ